MFQCMMLKQLCFSHKIILYVYIFLFIFVFIKECLPVCKFAVYACYACMQYIYIQILNTF